MKRWTIVFRALANINRLKIIAILSRGHKINVGDIAKNLGISPEERPCLFVVKKIKAFSMGFINGYLIMLATHKIQKPQEKLSRTFLF